MEMWEIMVPTVRNDGRPYRTRYHRVWDARVREITGGLTIMRPAVGHWVSPSGDLFVERVIPVRIACNKNAIEKIMDMTLSYYSQEAVLAYRVSDEVLIRRRE